MNGEKVDLGEMPAAVRVNHELVRLLDAALSDAKAGRMVAGGVAAVVAPSSFVAFSAMGNHPGEVIAAAEVMKADIIEKLRQPRTSPIMRPGMGGPRLRS